MYVSLSGYGQATSWRNRPAFAPTVQAETGLTAIGCTFSARGSDIALRHRGGCLIPRSI
ncbi:MAG TPA: CoA transferase [Bradyrhizobium sp.]|uniref:CoA transferase n=1 Tax=Bradyrhizobium sp. TaxID=376 RepID=UPI002B9B8244|nr:CoA transferase [Bradyrhizobium sp.]HXB78062.1 CoA transferase [Bradyrhizobium sp.]